MRCACQTPNDLPNDLQSHRRATAEAVAGPIYREPIRLRSLDTYAFTNQWGHRTLQAIDSLKEAFPDTEMSYEKSS